MKRKNNLYLTHKPRRLLLHVNRLEKESREKFLSKKERKIYVEALQRIRDKMSDLWGLSNND